MTGIAYMEVPPLRLVLEIDPMAKPLTGILSQSGAAPQTFTGWTQLGHAVDTAIAAAAWRRTDPERDDDEAGTP